MAKSTKFVSQDEGLPPAEPAPEPKPAEEETPPPVEEPEGGEEEPEVDPPVSAYDQAVAFQPDPWDQLPEDPEVRDMYLAINGHLPSFLRRNR